MKLAEQMIAYTSPDRTDSLLAMGGLLPDSQNQRVEFVSTYNPVKKVDKLGVDTDSWGAP